MCKQTRYLFSLISLILTVIWLAAWVFTLTFWNERLYSGAVSQINPPSPILPLVKIFSQQQKWIQSTLLLWLFLDDFRYLWLYFLSHISKGPHFFALLWLIRLLSHHGQSPLYFHFFLFLLLRDRGEGKEKERGEQRWGVKYLIPVYKFVCIYMCIQVYVHKCVHECRSQRSKMIIGWLSQLSPLHSLFSEMCSLNLELPRWQVSFNISLVTFSLLSAQVADVPNSDRDSSVGIPLPHPISSLVFKTASLPELGSCQIS